MSRRTRPPTDGVEMRLTPAMLVLASILISGCASQSVDCAMGVGHNRCTPGTKEYEQMMQKQQDQQDAKTAAEIDDARCRSYGAPGSPEYVECRRRATEDQRLLGPSR